MYSYSSRNKLLFSFCLRLREMEELDRNSNSIYRGLSQTSFSFDIPDITIFFVMFFLSEQQLLHPSVIPAITALVDATAGMILFTTPVAQKQIFIV